jgi:uncharacterized damage-inducible protein DinB
MNLLKLIDYDEWANHQIFEAIQEVEGHVHKKEIWKLFSHLLAAQNVWINRVQEKPNKVEIWPNLSIDEVGDLLKENPIKLRGLIPEKDKVIHYENSKGRSFQNKVEEIVMHIVIHGQHHRAQISKLLRQAGISPPGTDFIFFLRTLDN